SRDRRLLAAGGGGGTLTVWDWQHRLAVSDCRGSCYDVTAVAFSPGGSTLASRGRYEARILEGAPGRENFQKLPGAPRISPAGCAFPPTAVASREVVCTGLRRETSSYGNSKTVAASAHSAACAAT